MQKFLNHKVDVRGLSRKEAALKRNIAYKNWLLTQQIKEVVSIEESRNERNAWKVRSYLANKERQ